MNEDLKKYIESLIQYLEVKKKNQSMSEEFMDGYNYAIYEIKNYYG